MRLARIGLLAHSLVTRASFVFPYPNCRHFKVSSRKNEMNGSSDLDAMRLRVREQGDIVRRLKAEKASEFEVRKAVSLLKNYKRDLEDKEIELLPKDNLFDRHKLEDLLKQRFFYDQSFSIYGGVQGLYDFGPMGCSVKTNLLSLWRRFFVLGDQLFEVDCSVLTPDRVLQVSGHVDRFTDLMVKDLKTGDCFRADHLVKGVLEARKNKKHTTAEERNEIEHILIQLDNYGETELQDVIQRFGIKSPLTQNDLSEPQAFNLMFSTSIGPTSQCKGYLRPETAQGIFVNFQRLLQFNYGHLPFGAAQIGLAFRNEISPRSGLIRVREFTMAEIEYFVDPSDKRHNKFNEVRETKMQIFSACGQMDGASPLVMTIGEAVDEGIVANETLGYFMARIYSFLMCIGLDSKRVRFRQHLSNEMAHYACDCWDAECLTSYGWIECVGCADRSCYDLNQHANATGVRLVVEKRLEQPRTIKTCHVIPNKPLLGKVYRNDVKSIVDRLSSLGLNDLLSIKNELDETGKTMLMMDGKQFQLDTSMIQLKEKEVVSHVDVIVPNVIEPSFGINRLMYSMLEHSFRVREGDEQRTFLSIPIALAPYKCSLLPLSSNTEFSKIIRQLSIELTKYNVSHRIDEATGSIGRRYARTDQIGIPYGITVDFDTINRQPNSATLRERDSMKQIRIPLTDLPAIVSNLTTGHLTWTEAQHKYPIFEQQESVQSQNVGSELDRSLSVEISQQVNGERDLNSFKHRPSNVRATNLDTTKSTKTRTQSGNVDVCGTRRLHSHVNQMSSDSDGTSWSKWGKAVRNYEDEEQKEKLSGSQNSTEGVVPLLFLSGYEADHEDNIISGSAHTAPSQSAYINDIEQGRVDRPLELENHKITKVGVNCSDVWPTPSQAAQFSKMPHHGLFVGDNWPTHSAKRLDKPLKSNVESKACSSDLVKVHTNPGANPIVTVGNSDWRLVLARIDNFTTTSEMSEYLDALPIKSVTSFIKENPQLASLPTNGASVVQQNELISIDSKTSLPSKLKQHPSTNNISLDRIKDVSNDCNWMTVVSQLPESYTNSGHFHLGEEAIPALVEVYSLSQSKVTSSLAKTDDLPQTSVKPCDESIIPANDEIAPSDKTIEENDSKLAPKSDVENVKKRKNKGKRKKK